jgi:hypothetical protein
MLSKMLRLVKGKFSDSLHPFESKTNTITKEIQKQNGDRTVLLSQFGRQSQGFFRTFQDSVAQFHNDVMGDGSAG